MKSYRTLALKELLSQKVTSILILIAVVLSTMMTTIVGQSIGVLSAMREQQAIAVGGNRYATFLQMNAEQLHALEQDERLSYVGKSIYMGSLELSPSLTLGLMEYLDDIDIAEFREIPTYKRMCLCILRNDYACKYMGFAMNKEEKKMKDYILQQYKKIWT